MNNWRLPKRLIGEVDVFQIDSTQELYAHMNVNYVRLNHLPRFDHYGQVLEVLNRGDYFVSTGEVLLPKTEIRRGSGDRIVIQAELAWTFPLQSGRSSGAMGSARNGRPSHYMKRASLDRRDSNGK